MTHNTAMLSLARSVARLVNALKSHYEAIRTLDERLRKIEADRERGYK